MTGLDLPEQLCGSDSLPWAQREADEQRLDLFNGLRLAPPLDASFDAGLPTANGDGSVHVSGWLASELRVTLGVSTTLHVSGLRPQDFAYLASHRARVWKPSPPCRSDSQEPLSDRWSRHLGTQTGGHFADVVLLCGHGPGMKWAQDGHGGPKNRPNAAVALDRLPAAGPTVHMVARTPSPLRWLIDQRLRLEGELERLSKLKSEVDDLYRNVKVVLDAVCTTTTLHEVPVDFDGVPGITSQRSFKKGDPGSFKRLVVQALKTSSHPLTTKQVAALVRASWPADWGPCQEQSDLHNNVRYALKSMRNRGDLMSPVYGRAGKEATWLIKPIIRRAAAR